MHFIYIDRMGKPKAKSKSGAKQKTTSKKPESKHNINDLLDKVNLEQYFNSQSFNNCKRHKKNIIFLNFTLIEFIDQRKKLSKINNLGRYTI